MTFCTQQHLTWKILCPRIDTLPPAAYTELVEKLVRATKKLYIEWPDEPHESKSSMLDECFLRGPNFRPAQRKLPFFRDLHHKISRCWKQPFSARLTNAVAADFTNLVGSVEQDYATIPAFEDTLSAQPSVSSAQADMTLHTMAVLQVYQAYSLKQMDEGGGLIPEVALDLVLCATKHTARVVGSTMVGLVAAECHHWLKNIFSLTPSSHSQDRSVPPRLSCP